MGRRVVLRDLFEIETLGLETDWKWAEGNEGAEAALEVPALGCQ